MQRVVVIGARRVRQGTGEFLARAFEESGAEIVGAVGTSEASVADAMHGLRARHGIDARGYTRLEDALDAERPDIVVIASPFEAHRAQLEAVARAGSHCLCEKPLWWPAPGESLEPTRVREETERLVRLFEESGRLLAVSTQWPMTLEGYYTLFPQERDRLPESFAMELGPTTTGQAMVLDAGSHPLSLLTARVGPGRVERIEVAIESGDPYRIDLSFDFVHERGTTRSSLGLLRCPTPPRPAAYGFNGRIARRTVRLPEYEQTLVRDPAGSGTSEEYALDDPLRLLVARFLATIGGAEGRGPAASARSELVAGMEGLAELFAAVARVE